MLMGFLTMCICPDFILRIALVLTVNCCTYSKFHLINLFITMYKISRFNSGIGKNTLE
jgi:hypothetical protein